MPTDPAQFQPTTTRPPDFDAFWAETIAATAAIPLRLSIEPDPLHSLPDVTVSQVRFDSLGGVRVFGWLSEPAKPGRHPAVFILPGYGGASVPQRLFSREGFVALALSPRGQEGSRDQFNPGFPGLMLAGIEDKATYAYRGIYMDCWRALDVLLSLPSVDPQRVAVIGSSQGGALTIVTAGLRHEMIAAAPDVPFLCAMRDAIDMTIAYPYAEVANLVRQQPQRREAVLQTLDYFDILNFAPAVRCPTLLSIGLQDITCPPETGYALYRALPCEKELVVYPQAGHEGGGFTHADRKLRWLKKVVGMA